ncbi:transposase [Frankia sp. Hr75.2]|nr:transposase [Frankia sp. Hr75.2]
MRLPSPFHTRITSLRRIIDLLDFEIDATAGQLAGRLARDPGYQALFTLPGTGKTLAAVFLAEIGDITRFPTPGHLTSWAGLAPRHRKSDTTVHRGHITKQGSTLSAFTASPKSRDC